MDRLGEWGFKSKNLELEDEFYFDYDAEEITNYQDPSELLAALKQKEEEVILAAQLGNALLLENRQLKEESQKLHEQYADKVEDLEQGRHVLRLKLAGFEAQREGQVGDLERDLRELSARADQLTRALGQSERAKALAQQEHQEHAQRLREQLSTAMEVQKAMSGELQALKQEVRLRSHNRPQDEELISAMREQVARLSQKEQALEGRLSSAGQENEDLRVSMAALHTRLSLLEQDYQRQSQQLEEAVQEAAAGRGRSQRLQAQLDELQEERSLQESRNHGDASLLSELETSLDTVGLGPSGQEITQDLSCILGLLLPLTHDVTHQEVTSSERPADPGQEGLQATLIQLRGVAQNLAHLHRPQGVNPAFVSVASDPCGKPSAMQELLDQNSRLQEENVQMRLRLKNGGGGGGEEEGGEEVQRAIRDRDEAIAKKNLMEAELVRSQSDMVTLNQQLLEAVQRKLQLAQELEAWQDDIQIIINQQLRTQHQSEQLQSKPPSNPRSFFRRPSMSPSRAPRPAPAPAWPPAGQQKPPSPWRDWLRPSKVAQHGT